MREKNYMEPLEETGFTHYFAIRRDLIFKYLKQHPLVSKASPNPKAPSITLHHWYILMFNVSCVLPDRAEYFF